MDFITLGRGKCVILAWGMVHLLAASVPTSAQQPPAKKLPLLRIGTGGPLSGAGGDNTTDEAARSILQSFIKEETGLENRITYQDDWCKLVKEMEEGRIQMGLFQGHEFAWAQALSPRILPLALAHNGVRYPVSSVMVNQSNPAKDFGGLEGQSLDIPKTGQSFQHVFVQTQSEHQGKPLERYFSRITTQENLEDALDDVVDGKTQAAVADQVALEAYKRRKPHRFCQLKEVARSKPVPPIVVAYCPRSVPLPTLMRFQFGFKDAARHPRCETTMMLLRLTALEQVPPDFSRVTAQLRKEYPPPALTVSVAK